MIEQGAGGGRRRQRDSDNPRDKQVLVRLNKAEYVAIAARAAAVGMRLPAYLAERGQEDLAPVQRGTSVSPAQLRALVAELYALKRILRGATTNLNQLTRVANATGEVPAEVRFHIERIARTMPRLEEFLDGLDEWMVP